MRISRGATVLPIVTIVFAAIHAACGGSSPSDAFANGGDSGSADVDGGTKPDSGGSGGGGNAGAGGGGSGGSSGGSGGGGGVGAGGGTGGGGGSGGGGGGGGAGGSSAIAQVTPAGDVYAVSDPHGEYPTFVKLLAAGTLVASYDPTPANVTWSGGNAVLVVVGDLIDKGAQSLEVIDVLRHLQPGAQAAGGQIVVTLGNHEAEFFADPQNSKATSTGTDKTGVDVELNADGIDPKSVAAGTDSAGRGAWLLALPFAAVVGDAFYAHAGDTGGASLASLEGTLTAARANGWGDPAITGTNSVLESRNWYGDWTKPGVGATYAAALGVKRIVFGHDPKAFGTTSVAASADHALVRIDTAMGLSAKNGGGVNPGVLVHFKSGGGAPETIDDAGNRSPLW